MIPVMLTEKPKTWICCGWTGPRISKSALEAVINKTGERQLAEDIQRKRAKVILELNDDIASVRLLLTPAEARELAEDLIKHALMCQARKEAAIGIKASSDSQSSSWLGTQVSPRMKPVGPTARRAKPKRRG